MATLQELTSQESGIIIFDDNSVMVCNWSSCGDGQRPILFASGLLSWDCPELLGKADELRQSIPHEHVNDIRDVLPGTYYDDDETEELLTDMDVIFDQNYDLPALFGFQAAEDGCAEVNLDSHGNIIPTSGTVYTIGDLRVIAPDGWN